MKMSKKFLTIIMSIVVAGSVVLTGCSEKTTPNSNTAVEAPSTEDNVMEAPSTEDNATEDNAIEAEEEVVGEQDPSPAEEMVFVITDGLELPASMAMSKEMVEDAYGIDTSLLESYIVKAPLMNVHATEIAVFEVKNEKDIEAIKAGIEKRQADLEAQWQSYLPAQLELVQNYKMAVKGNKVLFVISHEADQIVKNFEGQINH